MQLFYAPDIMPPLHTLGEEESKHCVRVLRLRSGGRIHITDGRGNLFCCEITDDNPKRCTVRVVSTEEGFEKMPYALTVAVAPTKNPDRFEWLLEKATEVGVTEFLPLDTAHSERHVFKPLRGEKVITAAMKQSLKAYRRRCCPSRPSARRCCGPSRDGVSSPTAPRPGRPKARPTCPTRSAQAWRPRSSSGPEGDFSPEEIDFALANGFEEITLGTQRLRTETAALVHGHGLGRKPA